jgi:5-methylcytosine-specific restriction endonuclease McrA
VTDKEWEERDRQRLLRSLGWSMELLASRKRKEHEAKALGVAVSSLNYTKRYMSNPEFRERERIRARDRKLRRASGIEAASDGSLTTSALVALFASAKCCPFCRKRMKSQEKSLDHIVPLSKGGAHSVLNVLVCCKRCNAKKHARPIALMLNDGQQLPLVAA